VRARRDTGDDTAVLAALQTIAAQCRQQLAATQDAALNAADTAMQRLRQVQASGDPGEMTRAYLECQAAVEHADRISVQVITAMQDLLAATVEVTGPALQRMQRALDTTAALTGVAQ
jgi:hypothetical protein